MKILDYFISEDNRLKPVEGCVLRYLFETAQTRGLIYVDTCLSELQKITKHKCDASTSKVVTRLCKWGYLRKEYYKAPGASWPHLRLYIRIPDEFKSKIKKCAKWLPKVLANILLSSSNEENNKTNKSFKEDAVSEEKKPSIQNTTAKDMLDAYQEIVGQHIPINKKLASYLMQAMKQTFGSLDEWKRYLKYKIKNNIKKPLAFLFYLLNFQQLEAYSNYLRAMEDAERQRIEATEKVKIVYQECVKHIENCGEPDLCKVARRIVLDDYGAYVYDCWMTKVRLVVIGGEVEVEYDGRSFAQSWVLSNYSRHWTSEMKEMRAYDSRRTLQKEDRTKGENQGDLLPI